MDSNQSPQQISRLTSWVGLISINLLLFGILEVGTRIYFSTRIGPQILLYGTPAYRVREQIREATDRAETEEVEKSLARVHRGHVGAYRKYVAGQSGSYSKYLPNQTKLLYSEITGELEAIRINNHGFRGKDFRVSKAPGVIRVLTLGASSTFGYRSQDHETYPHVLERLLNERGPADQRFEVINFGIPHATSEHIASLFLAEGVALAPEFVTFYAGANDSAIIDAVHGYWGELWLAFCKRLLVLNFADHLLNSTILRRPLERWSDAYAQRRSQTFVTNVQMLAEECRRRGIHFVPATQQLTSMVARKEQMRGLTYIQEVRWVEEQLTKGRIFGDVEMETWLSAATRVESLLADRDASARQLLLTIDKTRFLLIHARLMADFKEWATANAVDWVDMIEVLDLHRHYMLSWVHLHPKANRMIADAFATKILRACCATGKNHGRTMAVDHQ